MTTKVRQAEKDVVFFITITCHNWMPLFDTANCYDTVYNLLPRWVSLLAQALCAARDSATFGDALFIIYSKGIFYTFMV